MWPFRNRKSKADGAIEILDDAIQISSEKWQYFCETLVFRSEVSLRDKIAAFYVPAETGLRNAFPALKDAPDAILMMIVAKGIEHSRTHTKEQIEFALGVQLPE